MSVTAYPVILIDSATGSDSLASGAGPSTALTGSAAVSTGTTVVLDAGTDLSGVATDGSHVLYFADATAGNRNFTAINGTSGSGGATPTLTVEQTLDTTTKAWAIGGKRASLSGAVSYKLIDNNSAAGDAMPGWTMEMQSAHSETIAGDGSNRIVMRRAGSSVGLITIRGKEGAATLPLLTFTNNDRGFIPENLHKLDNFEIRSTNGTKNASIAVDAGAANSGSIILSRLKINHGTDKFWKGIVNSAGQIYSLVVKDCDIGNTVSDGVVLTNSGRGVKVENNYIHDCGGIGVNGNGIAFGTIIRGNIIADNVSHGCVIDVTRGSNMDGQIDVTSNTIDNNGGSGIVVSAAITSGCGEFGIANNIISNNAAYGLNFSDGGSTLAAINGAGIIVENNDFYMNTSGATNPSGLGVNNQTVDPQYVNASGGDYSIGTNLKAKGYPLAGTLPVGGYSSTYSYVDPGAAQRQEAGGGGGTMNRSILPSGVGSLG